MAHQQRKLSIDLPDLEFDLIRLLLARFFSALLFFLPISHIFNYCSAFLVSFLPVPKFLELFEKVFNYFAVWKQNHYAIIHYKHYTISIF